MEEGGQTVPYPVYKRLVMAKPEKVVKKAITDTILEKGGFGIWSMDESFLADVQDAAP